MLNIPEQNQVQNQNLKSKKTNNFNDIEKELSYKEIADTVNQAKIPKYQSDDNILEELEQFEEPQKPSMPVTGGMKKPVQKVKVAEEELLEEAPSPTEGGTNYFSYPQQEMQRNMSGEIQEIAESIIDEKWQEFTTRLGDFNLWKDRMENEIVAIKQEIIRTQANFNNLQRAVLGKVSDYNENITNLSSEMKALEQVFEKIMQPLTTNVKELNKITEKLKERTK